MKKSKKIKLLEYHLDDERTKMQQRAIEAAIDYAYGDNYNNTNSAIEIFEVIRENSRTAL